MRSEEDKIKDAVTISSKPYDDVDFLPIRQSIYINSTQIPEYDGDIFHRIVWCRPDQIAELPDYFASPSYIGSGCIQGTLPDDVFLGVLMAISVYPGHELIEKVLVSKPDDFKTYGVYTCRFYVEGNWCEVITDTCLPCYRDEETGAVNLVYSKSIDPSELWIPLIEKAYAKAVGCYEAIEKVKVAEALLHLTGGSVQQQHLNTFTTTTTSTTTTANNNENKNDQLYTHINDALHNDSILLLTTNSKTSTYKNKMKKNASSASMFNSNRNLDITERESIYERASSRNILNRPESVNNIDPTTTTTTAEANETADTDLNLNDNNNGTDENNSNNVIEMFTENRILSIIALREYNHIQLVLIHNPWVNDKHKYTGPWSQFSTEWDTFADVAGKLAYYHTIHCIYRTIHCISYYTYTDLTLT